MTAPIARPCHHGRQREALREQAEAAVRTLLSWAGEDPPREGLLDTPKRVVDAYGGLVQRYGEIRRNTSRARSRSGRLRRDDRAARHRVRKPLRAPHGADHRKAHVGYLPDGRSSASARSRVCRGLRPPLPGAGKTHAQIAHCIQTVLQPRGVAIVIEGAHECMTTRGVHKRGVSMITSKMVGSFREDARTRAEFLRFIDVARAARRCGSTARRTRPPPEDRPGRRRSRACRARPGADGAGTQQRSGLTPRGNRR